MSELVERACATPLIELMRSVPKDAVLKWQESDGLQVHCSSPVGLHLHKAADTIEALRKALSDLVEHIDEEIEPRFCEVTFQDALGRARQTLKDTA